MSSKTRSLLYVEVPAREIPQSIYRMAREMLDFVEEDLGLPRLRLHFFIRSDEDGARLFRSVGLRVLESVPVRGMYSKEYPDSVFVNLDADAESIAHEARHVWQERRWGSVVWRTAAAEMLELDADHYARSAVVRWRARRR